MKLENKTKMKKDIKEENKNSSFILKITSTFLILLFICSVVSFLTIPFLSNLIKSSTAQILWYPSLVIFLILSIIGLKDNGNNADEINKNRILNFVGGWGIFIVTITVACIFMINYYNFDNVVRWLLFALMLIVIPIFFFSLYNYDLKNNKRSKEEIAKGTKNILKYIFLYILLDILYMAIFNNFTPLIFVVGLLAVLVMFYNISNAFLNGPNQFAFLILIDFVLTLCLSIYLIYIIPNVSLRNIVLSISAAVLGGGFTLLGVAWTIKKSDKDRKEDFERLESERKADERRHYRPFIYYCCYNNGECFRSIPVYDFLQDYNCVSKIGTLELNTPNYISNCCFSNTDFSNFYLCGLKLNNKMIEFRTIIYVKKDEKFRLDFTKNPIYTLKPIDTISLVLKDMLENFYELPLEINHNKDTNSYYIIGNKPSKLL